MRDWYRYWNTVLERHSEKEFLLQIDRSVNKMPISQEKFQYIIDEITTKLSLSNTDRVVDLCCGNGILTRHIATSCNEILGIDFSHPLINIANRYHRSNNVSYLCASVLSLPKSLVHKDILYDKAYMNGALQYFSTADFVSIIKNVKPLLKDSAWILFASIPDQERLWDFYNTPELKQEYHRRMKQGNEAVGMWWRKSTLRQFAAKLGYSCKFLAQKSEVHTSHYRFDMLLRSAF